MTMASAGTVARAHLALTSGLAQLAGAGMKKRALSPLTDGLLAAPRTQARAAARFALADDLPPLEGSDGDICLAASPEDLTRTGLIAGALWLGNDIAAVVRREDRAEIIQLIGAEARLWVVKTRSFPRRQAQQTGIGRLLADISAAADCATGAWIRTRPEGLRRRLELIRPVGASTALPEDQALPLFEAARAWAYEQR